MSAKTTNVNSCWTCGKQVAQPRNPTDAAKNVRQDVYDYHCRCGNQTFLAYQTQEQAREAWNRENPKDDSQ